MSINFPHSVLSATLNKAMEYLNENVRWNFTHIQLDLT